MFTHLLPLLIPFGTELLRTINLVLEGTSVEERRAKSYTLYVATWPLVRRGLSALKVSDEDLNRIEVMAKGDTTNE